MRKLETQKADKTLQKTEILYQLSAENLNLIAEKKKLGDENLRLSNNHKHLSIKCNHLETKHKKGVHKTHRTKAGTGTGTSKKSC